MPKFNQPIAGLDRVLDIEGQFLDIRMSEIAVIAACTSEVIGQQDGIKGGVGLESRRGALRGAGESTHRLTLAVHAGCIEGWAYDAEAVTFPKKSLGVKNAALDALIPLGIREIGMDSGIGERSILRDRLVLQVRRTKIRQRVLAGKVLIAIFANVRSEVEYRVLPQDPGIGGRNIERLDLRVLIGIAHVIAKLILHVQVVIAVRGLKPGPAVVQVQVQCIDRRKLVIHPIKDVLFVALVVKNHKFWSVQKATGIQAIEFEEVSPGLGAVANIESSRCRAKCPVGRGKTPGGFGKTLPRSRGYLNHQACLIPVLRRWRAGNDLNRLNGIGGDLVGENLALLVGDRLAVYGKRVGGMIAKSMEKSVGIRCDAGSRQGHQRAHGGRGAFQRQLLDQVAVDIGVKRGVIFHQIISRDRNGGGGSPHLQFDRRSYGDRGSHRHVRRKRSKPRRSGNEVIRIERQIGKSILTRSIRFRSPRKPADRIFNADGGAGNYRPRSIRHASCDRTRGGLGMQIGGWPEQQK